MGVTTLDMVKMAQQVDSLGPETSKRYMHHYNFPRTRPVRPVASVSPKRREIGHGALAERALVPVLPSQEEFPYAIRQVSEALSSNGSTSMGSVCASTLSLLNAGVPLKAPVAGIAMGLVSTRSTGRPGTSRSPTSSVPRMPSATWTSRCGHQELRHGLQLDTKLDGIPSQVLAGALSQAHDARTTIPRSWPRPSTPRRDEPVRAADHHHQVPVDKIGEVIGPKGKMINSITEETGANISIEDDGTVYVGAADGPSAQAAIDKINAIANPQLPKVGERSWARSSDHRLRRVRLAAPGPRRTGAHLQAGQRQEDRQGRGRRQRGLQAPRRDRRHRQPRQDLADPVEDAAEGSAAPAEGDAAAE